MSHLTCTPSPLCPSSHIPLPLHLALLATGTIVFCFFFSMQIHFIFASPFYFFALQCFLASQILPCTGSLSIQTIQKHGCGHSRRQTHVRAKQTRQLSCACSNVPRGSGVGLFFFFRMLFWPTEKPVGIRQEFTSDIRLWIILDEQWVSHRDEYVSCSCWQPFSQNNM